ncbi:MAG: TonB-dependent receptor [Sphingomonadales bacterium]|nr:MAG: TonB-dependent receptor [Sphingomonadales bacterium]
MKALKIMTALLAGVSSFGISHSALAQDVPSQAEETAASDETPQGGQSGGEIVVTGSRTITNGNASPVPVTVVTTDQLTNVRPTSLTESIQVLPVFSGSRSQMSNPSATGGVGGGNGVAAQLNLRNIGATRNLVLMDGRRVPPTSVTNIVDADVIPQLLIERVDTVTGGVSAVYGSDAVTGVVNFITNKKFKGVRAYLQGGLSGYGDGAQMAGGFAAGTDLFGGRGHITASYEYRDDEGIDRRSARGDWLNRPVVVGSGTAAAPYRLITNATLANLPFGGRITCSGVCAINGQYFPTDGVLAAFVNGTAYAGTPNTQVGGAGGYSDLTLKAQQTMHQVYSRFDFDVSDDIHFFALGSGTFKHNEFYTDNVQLANITLSRTNAFLPTAYQAQIPTATFTYNRLFAQAPRTQAVPESRQLMFVGGLNGKLGGFDWNLAFTHGDSRLKTQLRNVVNNQNLSAALDAVTSGGQTVCYAATQASTAAAYANCAPLNLFGPTSASFAAIDYILDDTLYVARTKQDDLTFDVSGSPFDTWAGPLTVALSGEWRKQSFSATSNGTPSMYANCTNLRYNCTAYNPATSAGTFLFRNTFPASPLVKQSVIEGAVEANVPLLKDVPFFQSLSVNGAARFTSYDTVGDYWTYKIGADWQISDDLRFRGTISRDIRAPTLNDLFAPLSVVVGNYTDLKTGNTAQTPGANLPNANLTAEIGSTKTVGAVFKPSFLPGFSFAVDYYDLKITNAITTVQGFQPNIQNGCLQGVQLYCDLIIRDGAGVVTQYVIRPINLAKVTTYGVDFEANYATQLFGQPFSIRALAAYQPHIRYIQPSVPTLDQGGVAFGSMGLTASPKWRLTGIVNYAVTDTLTVNALYRWRNKMKLWGDSTVVWAPGEGTVRAYGQVSLNVAWQLPTTGGKSEVFLNIQNLLDAKPPIANSPGTSTGPGGFGGFALTDDAVGRYWTAGLRFRF